MVYTFGVRIEEIFSVNRSPEEVFDYMTDPANLAGWQTSKTSVEQLTEGPPQLGTRVRERTKPPGGRESRVHFMAEGQLSGALSLLQPVAKRVMARQFAEYHRNLRRNVER